MLQRILSILMLLRADGMLERAAQTGDAYTASWRIGADGFTLNAANWIWRSRECDARSEMTMRTP
ncbi:MAG: hypothetical protein AAGL90_09185 [Pseudomonadota bacterium]